MTTGSGLSLNPGETSLARIVAALRQLAEGRSNAVGVATLVSDGVSTTTPVTAVTCGPNSVVLMFPATAHAATALGTTYVLQSNIAAGSFKISHAATTQADQTFMWLCIG